MRRGRPVSSILSDISDVDLEGLAEGEFERLQRQFRNMESDRQAYSTETQDLIRRQLAEIKKLEKERDDLILNTQLSESRVNQLRDQDKKENLRSLLDQKDRLEDKLTREKQTIANLDQEIKSLEKKISEQRKRSAGPSGPAKQNLHLQKNIKKMENRLDRSLTKFNDQLTKNSKLREELDILKVERSRFEQLYRKLEKEMHDTRRIIGSVIETSSAAYDARDEAQMKMLQLKEKAEKDLAQHAAEIKELQRIIDHDRKLKEFMGIKGQERSSDEDEMHHKRDEEESEKRKRDSKEETVESYELAFQKIRKVMGEDNLDVLVRKFIEVEDRNFALFNYVNEQNSEIEILRESISEIQGEIETFKSQTLHLENEHKKILKELEFKLNDAVHQSGQHDKHQQRWMKIVDQLKAGVDSLFKKINCDHSVLDEMLGASAGIRNNNIMQYMGLIEQRTNEILSIQSYLNSKDYDKPYNPQEAARFLLGQSAEMPSSHFSIQPPSTGEDYDSEGDLAITDEEERPLTQSELREKIIKGVLKKEEKASKKGQHNDTTAAKEVKVHRNSLLSTPRKHQEI
ncbi:coiled-coil domain-containing protein 63-like [Protopterus annectens]|uniref:coiled-coil domain-containing protein 63-like n=1 Tax=Protopterus annectens TaxID=7888 RepID=UPI001CF98FDD|nr:coiled-coil domain-containing protein 63-like [Protopterus annectens]